MTSFLPSVIFWLPWLSVILTCVWAISSGIKENTKKSWTSSEKNFPPATFIPEVQRRGRMTIWIGLILGAVFAVTGAYQIGKDRGYGIRDHELIQNTRMYFGVTILSQQSDRRYTVKIPGFEKSYPWDFCNPVSMPSRLIDIKYEQKTGCKVIGSTGFLAPHEEKTNGIQTGLDSATAKPATWAGLEARR